jgi:16S rRNA U1498 N3-methylase RsmE
MALYVAPLKGGQVAWTLQQRTEIGAAAFVPILTARTVAQVGGAAGKLKRRWRLIRETDEPNRLRTAE